jgi:glyoxylate/hydroxypyruvate reductase A
MKMNEPIAFISKMDNKQKNVWLECLHNHLPDENIILIEALSSAQLGKVKIAIVANPEPSDLTALVNLVWVQSLWAGIENLAAEPELKNIPIVRLIDNELANIMSEAIIAWSLYLHRRMPEYLQQQKLKKWQQLTYKSAKEQRITVLGAGELGLAAIKSLLAFGFQVNAWSRTEKNINGINHFCGEQGLFQALSQTDILISLLPLTPQTRHLLDKTTLLLLPKGAQLINFSRGGVINHNDLVALLNSKHIKHAVLDVFEQEPLPISSKLWLHENITILPHISAPTQLQSASLAVANNIQQYRTQGIIAATVDKISGY